MPAPASPAPPLPSEARRSLAIYNAAFPLVFLLLLPGALLRMWRRGNFRAHFGERLGRYAPELAWPGEPRRPVWIQSISVGETLVALKLARELHQRDPETRVLLSVVTVTGFAVAQEQASEWLTPIYQPLDLRSCVRRALDTLRPARLIIIEGGMWPNLLAECVRRGLPTALVSARLSPRSARRFAKFARWVGPLFRLLDVVGVTDAVDLDRWAGLGMPRAKLHLTGSVKFDQQAAATAALRTEEFRALLAALGHTPEAPVLVAGSTHAGEELLLGEMWRRLRVCFPQLVLIITPRHVERAAAIQRELETAGLPVVRRTQLPAKPAPEAILLVDTTGELRDWYTLATLVFVGKSLTAIGGQNPAEPAMLGKPVLFGPHMENFEALVKHLRAQQASVQVPDAAALEMEIAALLADAPRRAALAERGQHALAVHQGATRRTVALLAGEGGAA